MALKEDYRGNKKLKHEDLEAPNDNDLLANIVSSKDPTAWTPPQLAS